MRCKLHIDVGIDVARFFMLDTLELLYQGWATDETPTSSFINRNNTFNYSRIGMSAVIEY